LYVWQLLAHFISYVILWAAASTSSTQLLLLLLLKVWQLHTSRLQKV
jgi:hypothetical protein